MKFAVISRGDEHSNDIKSKLQIHLENKKLEMDNDNPNIVITVGGDGTLLYAFHRYKSILDHTAFVGIHTGHLGFYADWSVDEMVFLALEVAKEQAQIVEYPLLSVELTFHDEQAPISYLALNESTVKSVAPTLVVDVEINNAPFECFRGDGLCFSTPSGSTAYNKSLGGALIHPSIPVMQMAEMASINNRVYRTIGSSLVFPEHHIVKLYPNNQDQFRLSIDHLNSIHTNVKTITFKVSERTVRFARYRSFPFWNRVRDSFIGMGR